MNSLTVLEDEIYADKGCFWRFQGFYFCIHKGSLVNRQRKLWGVPLVCHGHSRPVVDVSYSPVIPNGFFLISASKDSNPMLRNGETGDWIGIFEGHKGAVWSCSLDKHAMRAASASADFTVRAS